VTARWRVGPDVEISRGRERLGHALRQLRVENRWTLKDLSVRTGIPLSTLSKVEHGRLSLTYDRLVQLSQRLNLPLADVFDSRAPADDRPPTGRRSIGRLDSAVRRQAVERDWYFMCPELRRKQMIPVVSRIRSKRPGAFLRYPGEAYVYVLEGSVEIHTEYYDPVMLPAGESIYLDAAMGHALAASDGCDEALVLGVSSGVDEGVLEAFLTQHGAPARPDD
jgi:transcriptional regulator with XRE-family HTH domain